jgi:hypothetical protein
MATAYTPGLKVSVYESLAKRRILPLKGEVLVSVGDRVKPETVVARSFLPGKVGLCNVANKLGIDGNEVPGKMLKKVGDEVTEGEVIAFSKSFFGLFKSQAESNMDGTIESISAVTGQVIIRGAPRPVEVTAYIDGKITQVIEEEGVVVETQGAFIQGIFGVAGETWGELVAACTRPGEVLDDDHVKPEHAGKIIFGGSLVTNAALKKAIKLGVKGVVVGGFDDQDLREFLGYDLGVAITGHEDLGITLVVTEGFGQIDMAPRTFALLTDHVGKRVSINGATQIRAGVIRPEVVIPLEGGPPPATESKHVAGQLDPGASVRVIRAPYFGVRGKVTSLPPEPRALDSESKARVVEIESEDGETLILPRANVEIIEE